MTPRYDNPYVTPSVVSELPERPAARVSHSFAAMAVSAALAYIAFTVVLFFSGPGDWIGGMMFLVNIPVLIGLAVSAFWSTRISVYCAAAASLVQIGITIAMIVMRYGDTLTVMGINSAIILPLFVVSIWAWCLNCRPRSVMRTPQING